MRIYTFYDLCLFYDKIFSVIQHMLPVTAGRNGIPSMEIVLSLEPMFLQGWLTEGTFHSCLLIEIMQGPLPKYPPSLITLQELCTLVSHFCHPDLQLKFSACTVTETKTDREGQGQVKVKVRVKVRDRKGQGQAHGQGQGLRPGLRKTERDREAERNKSFFVFCVFQ